MKIEANLWPLEGEHSFKAIWPSDLVFNPTWSDIKIEAKLWPLKSEQGLEETRPSDLVFYPTWPIFKFDQDIIKTNILI